MNCPGISPTPSPGPTAYFGLVNCVARHDIKEAGLGTVSEAFPHLIFEARPQRVGAAADVSHTHVSTCLLQGFSTPLGKRVSNILRFLFPVPKDDRCGRTAGEYVNSRV